MSTEQQQMEYKKCDDEDSVNLYECIMCGNRDFDMDECCDILTHLHQPRLSEANKMIDNNKYFSPDCNIKSLEELIDFVKEHLDIFGTDYYWNQE